MKITKPLLLLVALFLSVYSNAVLVPATPAPSVIDPFKIKPREIEKLTGKRLTLFQKIKIAVAQKALKRYSSGQMTTRQERQARWSMILGLSGVALILLALSPALGVLAIAAFVAAVAAVILGAKSLKGNRNKEGKIGILTGGLTILFILLVMMAIALTLSA